MLGETTYQELKNQREALHHIFEGFSSPSKQLEQLLASDDFEEVVFTGCGSSYYISQSASSVYTSLNSTKAHALPSSEIFLSPHASLDHRKKYLLVPITRSGATTETMMATNYFVQNKLGSVFYVTCEKGSPITKLGSVGFVEPLASEKSIVMTRSFTAMYYVTMLLSALRAKSEGFVEELRAVPEKINQVMENAEPLVREIANITGIDRFFYLGNGACYGIANEAMLKIKEMSCSFSEAYHFLEFRHGPMSMVTPTTLITGLLSDSAANYELNVLRDMKHLGARIFVICETREGKDLDFADYVFELDSGLSELARSPLLLPVVHLLAFYRALFKNLDPDFPTHLSKVVRI